MNIIDRQLLRRQARVIESLIGIMKGKHDADLSGLANLLAAIDGDLSETGQSVLTVEVKS